MTISIDTVKAFDQIKNPFMIKKKRYQQVEYEKNVPQYN